MENIFDETCLLTFLFCDIRTHRLLCIGHCKSCTIHIFSFGYESHSRISYTMKASCFNMGPLALYL